MNCPNCGSANLRVITGTHDQGCRLRHRRCGDCGRKVKTIEVPVADAVIGYRATMGKRAAGSRLAINAGQVMLVRRLLAQLQSLASAA